MAFKALKAKPINRNAMMRELKLGVETEAKNVFSDFAKTTQSWNNKVTFTAKVRYQGGFISFLVTTDSKLYTMMDITGAKRHRIAPKTKKFLYYQKDFSPKTTVGSLDSVAGGKSGRFVRRLSVDHPGFLARKYSELIAKKTEKRFLQGLRIAMANAVDASGHRL